MKVEHLSNELLKWMHGDAKTSVYCTRYNNLRLDAPFAPPTKLIFTPIRTGACVNKLHPSHQRKCLKVAEQKERPQTILWNLGINGEDCVSRK